MLQAMGVALTAIDAFNRRLDVNANNIANMNSNNFKKSRVEMQEAANGGVQVTINKVDTPGREIDANMCSGQAQQSSNVNLEEEIVDQIVTQYSYEANIMTIKTAAEMQKVLINIKA